jgi:PEP-CTERM motif
VLACVAVGSASAQYAIDNMLVFRPAIGTYVDEFSDGIAPPLIGPGFAFDAGATPGGYFLNTGATFAPGAEAGGLLTFNRSGAAPSCTTFFGCPLQQRVFLDTGFAPGATTGLRKAYDFYAVTSWVLTNPTVGDDFRITLNDGFQNAAANDYTDIRVRHGAAGPTVAFRTLDLSNGAVDNIASVDLGATTADRIIFYFAHASGSSFVNAAYQLVQGVVPLGGLVSLGQAELFRGEDATRFSFGANFAVAAIPEPGTYALMFGGLGVIGWMTRRRKR